MEDDGQYFLGSQKTHVQVDIALLEVALASHVLVRMHDSKDLLSMLYC